MANLTNQETSLARRGGMLSAPVAADPVMYLPKVEPARLLGVLFRRGWIVVLLGVIGIAAALWFAGKQPEIFRAKGSVYVSDQAPQVLDIRAVAPEGSKDLEQMRSVEQGLLASALLLRVIEANGLEGAADFGAPGMGKEALLGLLSSRVSVELRRGTRIIDISVDDTDAERARVLVESMVREYEAWTTERQQGVTKQASEGLSREEERLRKKMEDSAARLQEFRREHPLPGLDSADGGAGRDNLGELNRQLTQAKAERLKLEAEYEALAKFDAADADAVAALSRSEHSEEVIALVRAIQAKEVEFAKVKERYLEKHPVYKEMANELARLKQNLTETAGTAGRSLEQQYEVAVQNENKLTEALAAAEGTVVGADGLRERFRGLMREAEADRDLHASVALRLRETGLVSSVPASVLRWDDPPLRPERAHSPRKLVYAALGAFSGFFLGLFLVAGLEMGDGRVRDPGAATRATGLPLLVRIPHGELQGGPMVLLSNPASPVAEAFRQLSAMLAPPPENTTARTLMFASATSGEGKSFCALNHACGLAMQGYRTLLLDADMRRPGLSAEHFNGGGNPAGLGGYLDGKVEAAEACFTTSLPNLYLMSSGPMRNDAAELLGGTRFPALLEDAYRWFDRVVIDVPPVLQVSDALAVARYADRMCLVVKDRGSERRGLKRAADLLRSAGGNPIGLIWNEAPTRVNGPPSAGPVVAVSVSRLSSTVSQGLPAGGSRTQLKRR